MGTKGLENVHRECRIGSQKAKQTKGFRRPPKAPTNNANRRCLICIVSLCDVRYMTWDE